MGYLRVVYGFPIYRFSTDYGFFMGFWWEDYGISFLFLVILWDILVFPSCDHKKTVQFWKVLNSFGSEPQMRPQEISKKLPCRYFKVLEGFPSNVGGALTQTRTSSIWSPAKSSHLRTSLPDQGPFWPQCQILKAKDLAGIGWNCCLQDLHEFWQWLLQIVLGNA